jgi:S-adenosylmethionine decarboxylase
MIKPKIKPKFTQFGYHLTLDLYECEKQKLSDMHICYDLLEKIPKKLNMHALIPPYIIEAQSNENNGGKDPGGFTGFIIIAESHISLHTFVLRGFASIDVYSCKPFEKQTAIDHFYNELKPKNSEIHFIDRGLYYPTDNLS